MLANINNSLEGLSLGRYVIKVLERIVKCFQLFAEIIVFLAISFERYLGTFVLMLYESLRNCNQTSSNSTKNVVNLLERR